MTWYAMHPETGIVASRSTKGGVATALAELAELDEVPSGARSEAGLYTYDIEGGPYTVGTRETLGDGWTWAFEGRTPPAVHEADGFELVDVSELVVGDVVRMAGRMAEPIVEIAPEPMIDEGGRAWREVYVLDGKVERVLFLRGEVLARLDGERPRFEIEKWGDDVTGMVIREEGKPPKLLRVRQEPEEIEVREWAEPHPEKHDPDEEEEEPGTPLARSIALILAYDDTPRAEWESRRRELIAELAHELEHVQR